jgi:hypothetical protein
VNLGKLEEMAGKAQPGPWLYHAKSNHLYTSPPAGTAYTYGTCIVRLGDDEDTLKQGATIEYITAASPDVVLQLIAVARAAKYVAYSNGFDAALPDKKDALVRALKDLDAAPLQGADE